MLVCFVFLATDYYNIKERLFNKKKTAEGPKYLLRILNISHPQQLFILMLRPSHSSAQIFKISLLELIQLFRPRQHLLVASNQFLKGKENPKII